MISHRFESKIIITDDGISRQTSASFRFSFAIPPSSRPPARCVGRCGARLTTTCLELSRTHALKHSGIEYGVSKRVGVHPYTVDSVPSYSSTARRS